MQELIKNFDFNGQNVRVITNEKDQVFFVAKDICDILGYSNSRDTISKNCKKDGVSNCDIIDNLGRTQNTTIISEGNLYRLVLKSNKKESEVFESWVCDDVLPSIRKTGKYEITKQAVNNVSRTDLAQMVIDSEKENELLQIENQKLVGEVKTLENKTEYTEKVLKTSNTLLATEVCKEFGFKSANQLNKKLVEKGIIYKVRGHFVVAAKYAGKGYEKYSEYQYGSTLDGTLKMSRQMEWTQLGRAFLHSIFNKELSYSKSYTYPTIQLGANA